MLEHRRHGASTASVAKPFLVSLRDTNIIPPSVSDPVASVFGRLAAFLSWNLPPNSSAVNHSLLVNRMSPAHEIHVNKGCTAETMHWTSAPPTISNLHNCAGPEFQRGQHLGSAPSNGRTTEQVAFAAVSDFFRLLGACLFDEADRHLNVQVRHTILSHRMCLLIGF